MRDWRMRPGKPRCPQIERFEYTEGKAGIGRRTGFGAATEQLIQSWRFEPETFDGKPIASKGTFRVNYRLPGRGDKGLPDAYQQAKSSDACRVAGGETVGLPMALESMVKVTADPAG